MSTSVRPNKVLTIEIDSVSGLDPQKQNDRKAAILQFSSSNLKANPIICPYAANKKVRKATSLLVADEKSPIRIAVDGVRVDMTVGELMKFGSTGNSVVEVGHVSIQLQAVTIRTPGSGAMRQIAQQTEDRTAVGEAGEFANVTSLVVRVLSTQGMQFSAGDELRLRVLFGRQSAHISADASSDFNQALYFPCRTGVERSFSLSFEAYDASRNRKIGLCDVDLRPVLATGLYKATLELQTAIPTGKLAPHRRPAVDVEIQFSRHSISHPTTKEIKTKTEPADAQAPSRGSYKGMRFEINRLVNWPQVAETKTVKLHVSVPGAEELSMEGFLSGADPTVEGLVISTFHGDNYCRFKLTNGDGEVVAKCKFNLDRHILSTSSRLFSGFLYLTPEPKFKNVWSKSPPPKLHVKSWTFGRDKVKSSFSIAAGNAPVWNPEGQLVAAPTKIVDSAGKVLLEPEAAAIDILATCNMDGDKDKGMLMESFFMAAPTLASDANKHAAVEIGGLSNDAKKLLNEVDIDICEILNQPPTATKADEEENIQIAAAAPVQELTDSAKSVTVTIEDFPVEIQRIPGAEFCIGIEDDAKKMTKVSVSRASGSAAPVSVPAASELFLKVLRQSDSPTVAQGVIKVFDLGSAKQDIILQDSSDAVMCELTAEVSVTKSKVNAMPDSWTLTENEEHENENLPQSAKTSIKQSNGPGAISAMLAKRLAQVGKGESSAAMVTGDSVRFHSFTVQISSVKLTKGNSSTAAALQYGGVSLQLDSLDKSAASFPLDRNVKQRWITGLLTKQGSDEDLANFSIDVESVATAVKMARGNATEIKVILHDPNRASDLITMSTAGGQANLGHLMAKVAFHNKVLPSAMVDKPADPNQLVPVKITNEQMHGLTKTLGGAQFQQTVASSKLGRTMVTGAGGKAISGVTDESSVTPNTLAIRVVSFEAGSGFAGGFRGAVMNGITFIVQAGPPRKQKTGPFPAPPFEDQLYEQLGTKVTFPTWESSSSMRFLDVKTDNVTKMVNADLGDLTRTVKVPLVTKKGENIVHQLKSLHVVAIQRDTSPGQSNTKEFGQGSAVELTKVLASLTHSETLKVPLHRNIKPETSIGHVVVEVSFSYDAATAAKETSVAVKL